MSQLPGMVLWNPRWQAFDSTGAILPLAKLYAYTTGASYTTPKALYSNVGLTVALSNPVVADSSGRLPQMWMSTGGYDLRLRDANNNIIWSAPDVESIGQTFLAELGSWMASGTFDVASGYTVVAGDILITTAAVATSPFIVNLPALATWTTPITIKHRGSAQLRITPAGSDTIEAVAAYYAVAAAASPNLPSVTLVPGAASWWIANSHGL